MREPIHDRLEEGLDVRGTSMGMDSRHDGDRSRHAMELWHEGPLEAFAVCPKRQTCATKMRGR